MATRTVSVLTLRDGRFAIGAARRLVQSAGGGAGVQAANPSRTVATSGLGVP